jgi:hypothetical protein
MIASILIVGEDEMLSHTRAFLLGGSEWNIGTMNPTVTTEPIEARPYDLLIFCYTVSDDRTRELIGRAVAVSPHVKVLAMVRVGSDRMVEAANQKIEAANPERCRQAVRTLLN